jgi:hypothetical protein
MSKINRTSLNQVKYEIPSNSNRISNTKLEFNPIRSLRHYLLVLKFHLDASISTDSGPLSGELLPLSLTSLKFSTLIVHTVYFSPFTDTIHNNAIVTKASQ